MECHEKGRGLVGSVDYVLECTGMWLLDEEERGDAENAYDFPEELAYHAYHVNPDSRRRCATVEKEGLSPFMKRTSAPVHRYIAMDRQSVRSRGDNASKC